MKTLISSIVTAATLISTATGDEAKRERDSHDYIIERRRKET